MGWCLTHPCSSRINSQSCWRRIPRRQATDRCYPGCALACAEQRRVSSDGHLLLCVRSPRHVCEQKLRWHDNLTANVAPLFAEV